MQESCELLQGEFRKNLYFCRIELNGKYMSKKRKQKEIVRDVLIESAGAEGNAIGHVDGKVVFVQHVVPGDVVDVQPTKSREKYMEGYVVRLVKPSPDRIEPFCAHYGVCGGCKWQQLPYHLQIKYKHQQVIDQLQRIGHLKLDDVEVLPILPSEKTVGYRNKLEFSFSDRRWVLDGESPKALFDPAISLDPQEFEGGVLPRHLRNGYSLLNTCPDGYALGFHIPNAFDKILDIKHCYLQPEPSNEIRNFIRAYAIEHHLPFFNIREQVGMLRSVTVRTNVRGEAMVTLMFGARPAVLWRCEAERKGVFEAAEARGYKPLLPADCEAAAEKLFDALMARFPQIRSLNYLWNGRMNDAVNDQEVFCARGEDAIYEEMEGLRFKIGPKSFYQTNPLQAYRLYSVVRDFAGFKGGEHVFDLYTGTGTIALFVARGVKSVVGVEYVPEAIADAKINASLNGIDNCTFYAGDMKDVLSAEFIAANGGTPDVVILDPPRAGLHPDVVEVLLATASRKIVYVSCNPATQARDIAMLGSKYRLVKVQPVDMFPHTHHVENVVLLELKESEEETAEA